MTVDITLAIEAAEEPIHNPSRRQREVLELFEDGYGLAAVATMADVSRSYARRIQKEYRNPTTVITLRFHG